MADPDKPIEEDVRHDDLEFNPAIEPKSAKAWINLLIESEDAFEDWNTHCDKIDKQYAIAASASPTWRATRNSRCSGPTARC